MTRPAPAPITPILRKSFPFHFAGCFTKATASFPNRENVYLFCADSGDSIKNTDRTNKRKAFIVVTIVSVPWNIPFSDSDASQTGIDPVCNFDLESIRA